MREKPSLPTHSCSLVAPSQSAVPLTAATPSLISRLASGNSAIRSIHPFAIWIMKAFTSTLIDTPGYRDFYGRALSVLPAADTAAVVINAQTGIELVTRRMMKAAEKQRLCRMIIVNKIDAEELDLKALLEEIQSAFGTECLPLNLPSADGTDVVDCFFQPTGADTAFGSFASAHTQIVDQVVEVDEELMEIYLEQGEELQPEQLHDPFEKALREGHLVPVCFVSAKTGAGIPELLEVFERLMPSPLEGNPPLFLKGEGEDAEEIVITPDPAAHTIAHVFKVSIDPFKGRLGVCRVHQGTIKTGGQLYVGDARKPIKVNQLLKLNGDKYSKIDEGPTGDICAIARVDELHFDAVLHDSHDEDHFHLKSIDLPRPMFGLAIKPPKDADAQKTSDILHTIEAEDPSLNLEHNAALNEIVLRGLGDLHLRTLLELIADRHNLEVDTALPSIAYRETITKPAEGHCRHKKQTGGAGQFGEVYLRVEPLPPGNGFEFVSKVVGGAIPSQYIPAVETGVRQVMQAGASYGYPMQDIKGDGLRWQTSPRRFQRNSVRSGRQEGVPGSRYQSSADPHGACCRRRSHRAKPLCGWRYGRFIVDARHGKWHGSACRQSYGCLGPGPAERNAGLSFALEIFDRR